MLAGGLFYVPGPFLYLSGEMYDGVLLCALFIRKNPLSQDTNGFLLLSKALFFFTVTLSGLLKLLY